MAAYRDTITLLLGFISGRAGRPPHRLQLAYLQGYEVTSEHGDGSEIPRGRRDEDAQAIQPPPCAAAGWRPSCASFARTPARPREQVAEFVGCSPVTVTRIESAQRAPRLADTARMRDAS